MRTRFPKCGQCGSPIDPANDKFRVTNLDEAKYGRTPEYAHEVCPALASREDEALEDSFAEIAAGGFDTGRSADGTVKPD